MTTSPSHEPGDGTTGVPPEALERVKRERDQFKTQAEQAGQVAAAALLVDKVYGHLTGRQYTETELRPVDPYGTAKFIASQLPTTTADPAEAVDRWLQQASTLLRPPQVAAPQIPTVSPAPQVPMGRGPQPGADGTDLGTGPFPVNGKEFKEFVTRYGMAAVPKAVADGTFYFSDENQAAQATAKTL